MSINKAHYSSATTALETHTARHSLRIRHKVSRDWQSLTRHLQPQFRSLQTRNSRYNQHETNKATTTTIISI